MNGRIYDPAIGRMLSADLLVPNPMSLQDFNRYSYVRNNPLTFTDPSGFEPMGFGLMRGLNDHRFEKQFGADKAARQKEFQAASDKGQIIGAVAVVTVAVIAEVGVIATAKEVGSEIVDTAVEKVTGVPIATSISGLGKDLLQSGAKKLGKEGAEAAAEVVAKKTDDVAGSVPTAEKVAADAPSTPAQSQAGDLNSVQARTTQSADGAAAERIPHKNSLNYVGETHVYRVKGPDGTYKIGESAQGVRVSDGASIRAEQQARRLQRETGDRYETDIRKTFPDKASAREYETKLIERFRRLYGEDTLPGNKTNR